MNIKELISKYKMVGLKKSQVVYITSDFGKVISNLDLNKNKVLSNHFKAIKSIVGKNGTIVVPTATLNLCGTNKVFSPKDTQSYEMGAFSEYVRKRKESKRSLHPLWSVSAYGKHAKYITFNIPQHAFGYNSAFHRLIKKNAFCLSIGTDPRKSISMVHHVELVCGVPYRFTITFKQKIKIGKRIIKKEFYHFGLKNKNTPRDQNKKIFKNFKKKSKVNEIDFAKGKITFFSLKEFFNVTADLISKKPYEWTKY